MQKNRKNYFSQKSVQFDEITYSVCLKHFLKFFRRVTNADEIFEKNVDFSFFRATTFYFIFSILVHCAANLTSMHTI